MESFSFLKVAQTKNFHPLQCEGTHTDALRTSLAPGGLRESEQNHDLRALSQRREDRTHKEVLPSTSHPDAMHR